MRGCGSLVTSDFVNSDDERSEQTAKTLAEVTLDDLTWSVPHNQTHLSHPIATLVVAVKWEAAGEARPTNLSWHISFSCLGSKERGSKRAQNWHGAGSSEIAFSTARLRLHNVRLISHRHPGHVGVSSFRRASASRCDRQLAHIRWPLAHCNTQTSEFHCNCQWLILELLQSVLQVSKVLWQKAASPSCHPSQWRMESSTLDHHLTQDYLFTSLHPQNSISTGLAVFVQLTHVPSMSTQTRGPHYVRHLQQ